MRDTPSRNERIARKMLATGRTIPLDLAVKLMAEGFDMNRFQ